MKTQSFILHNVGLKIKELERFVGQLARWDALANLAAQRSQEKGLSLETCVSLGDALLREELTCEMILCA